MENNPTNPPKWPLTLLHHVLNRSYMEEIEGDLHERYLDNVKEFNLQKARKLYLLDSLKLLRPSLLKKLGGEYKLNQYGMFMTNLKIAWRQMRKQKIYSLIKIGGFSIGIAACILITLYIRYQVSYDQHYVNKDRIFRVLNRWSEVGDEGYWSNVHGPLKEVLEDNIPEMEQVARIVLWSWGDAGANHLRLVESDYQYYEEGFFYADPELLDILEIPMVYGTQTLALSEPNSMVISKKIADRYFPGQNPVGRRLILNNSETSTYTIGGVMEDFPSTSHLKGDFILTLYGRKNGPGTSGWCCTNYNMYARLVPQSNKVEVEKKTAILRNSHILGILKELGQSGLDAEEKYQSYYLQPIMNTYLNPEKVGDGLPHGSVELVWIFGCIAGIILLLACINFINLTTANSLTRAKEVGLRKVVGSFRSGLISHYLMESCLYSFMAVLLGTFIASIVLPFFNQLANTALTIPWTSIEFLAILLVSSLFIGLVSGIYPAFILSGFKPIDALKGSIKGGKTSILQNGMVVFQFATTVILIIGALVTHEQFQFIMNSHPGFEKDQVVNILGLDTMIKDKKDALKEELLRLSAVQSASLSDYLPVEGGSIQNRRFWISERRHLDNGFEAARWAVDEDYLKTMGIEVSLGRNFQAGSLDRRSIVINEKMAQSLGLEQPIGTHVIDMFDLEYDVIGVVKNFHFESLVNEVRPLAMVLAKGRSTLSVKITSSEWETAMIAITKVWDKFSPNQTIRYAFLDQRFELMYADLHRAKTIFIVFALLSIVIACLGLLALSIHMIEQRTKEMSIRKVLGASVAKIFISLTFRFLQLVWVAVIIAIPVAWYFVSYLLDEFAHRIALTWHIFIVAGTVAVLISVATISFEALKAARTNPANQLRNE